MIRRLLAAFLLAAALRASADAGAQPGTADRPYRIYAIVFRGLTDVEKGFGDYFTARHMNVDITYRDLQRDAGRLPGLLREIRRLKPDLVYTWGTSVTLGVVGRYDRVDPAIHITDIPVVFTLVAEPVGANIVSDLKSSRRNLTGVVHVAPVRAQVQAMANYRPFKIVGVLYTPTEANSVVVINNIERQGKREGFRVVARPFRLDAEGKATAEGALDLIRQIKKAGADWLYLPPDSFLGTQAEKLVIPAATAMGLPTFATTEQLMQAGALAGLVSRYYSIGQFTGYKAEQILVGKKRPSDIPIETLTRFSFQIRVETAKKLNLVPPLLMLNYAELM